MKRLLLLLSILTSSLSYVSLSEGCYDPEQELRNEIYGVLLDGKEACYKCVRRKVDYAMLKSEFRFDGMPEAERQYRLSMTSKATIYNCATCDKAAMEQTAQQNIPATSVAKSPVARKCIAIDSPSMASICACAEHKMLHSSYKK